jgi:PA domain
MRRVLPMVLVLAAALNAAAGTGRIIILNSDKPGTGFNDLTPATPVGGNSGTTLGAQRLNVFNEAARRWQNAIDTNVDILVTATFAPIPGCTASAAVLGQATPMYWKHSFAGAPRANVWYPAALANKFAGTDLDTRTDIFTQFNADVDKADCLSSSDSDWYYGFDGNHGSDIDLFVVVLHELAHGLGLAGKAGGSDFSENRPAIFNTQMLDLLSGLTWEQMSPEQRRVSLTNTGNVVWNGPHVREKAGSVLAPLTTLTVTAPPSVSRDYDLGFASFGPAARTSPLSGKIVKVQDGDTTAPSTAFDGCTALTNASEVAGNIALADRGNCTFAQKAQMAQAAGATGLIIVNVSSPDREETCLPPGLGGTADDVRIPVVSLSTRDGETVKAQLTANANVTGFLRVDPSKQLGSSSEGYVRLYAPCTEQPGSSIYHWDIVASPNLLMEPDINGDLLHGLDLTLYQLLDLGWTLPAKTGRRILKR